MPTPSVPFPQEDPGDGDSPQLDPWKTSVENPTQDDPDQQFRFADSHAYRAALLAALDQLRVSGSAAERFRDCGKNAWVMYSPSTGKYRVACTTCKNRWCPACHRRIAGRIAKRLRAVLPTEKARRWKFVTLTLRHSKRTLTDQLRHLRASFRRLRQRSFWRKKVRGGYAVLEVSYNEQTAQWHPHLHIVCDSPYIDARELSKQWLAATRDSMIVHVRAVTNSAAAVGYLTKYLGKLPQLVIYSTKKALQEYITGMAGTRLLQHFGDLPKLPPEDSDEETRASYFPLGKLSTLQRKAAEGNRDAQFVLAQLRRQTTDVDAAAIANPAPATMPPLLLFD